MENMKAEISLWDASKHITKIDHLTCTITKIDKNKQYSCNQRANKHIVHDIINYWKRKEKNTEKESIFTSN